MRALSGGTGASAAGARLAVAAPWMRDSLNVGEGCASRVRVHLQNTRSVGVLSSLTADSIAVVSGDTVHALARSTVRAIEISRGRLTNSLNVFALYERLKPWDIAPTVALTGGLIAPGRPLRLEAVHQIEQLGLGLPVLERRIDAARGAAALARAGFETPH